jgi:hypothetical protein
LQFHFGWCWDSRSEKWRLITFRLLLLFIIKLLISIFTDVTVLLSLPYSTFLTPYSNISLTSFSSP